MRKTNKIVSLLLAIVMILGIAVPMMASAETLSFSDVPATHNYYEAIMNLVAEGIVNGMGDGKYEPEGSVTRAQFAKIICYATGVGELKYSAAEKSIFTDVAPEHWASDNIKTAYDSKIINGMGDGSFAPENPVLYEQAVKMVVCALGYTQIQAEREVGGGNAYPMGYLSLANKAGILAGLKDVKQGEPLNRGAVAKIIDSMRNAKQMVDGEEGDSLREQSPTSAKMMEGRIIGLYGISLYTGEKASTCNKNQLELEIGSDRKIFDATEITIDVNKFLGRSAIVYYDDDKTYDYPVISNVAYQTNKNNMTEINLDSIRDYDSDYIEYYADKNDTKVTKVLFEADAVAMFNGQGTSKTLEKLIDDNRGKAGSITLVASSGGNKADVAFVKAYETIIVASIDTVNYIVTDLNGNKYTLNVNDRSKNTTILNSNKEYAFTSIKKNHIISIAESEDGNTIEALVSSRSVTGKVEQNDGDSIVLDKDKNTTYYFSDVLSETDKAALEVGNDVAIFLDAFDRIGIVTISSKSTYLYGYISMIGAPEDRNDPFQILLHTEGSIKGTVYDLAEKVKINNKPYDSIDDAHEIETLLGNAAADVNPTIADKVPKNSADKPGATLCSQPVRYILSSGKIQSIVTNIPSNEMTTPDVELGIQDYTQTPIKCTVEKKKLGNYNITSSTKFFYIPSDRGEFGSYKKWSVNNFKEGKEYYAQIANFSKGTISAVYVYGEKSGDGGTEVSNIDEDCKPMVVTESELKRSPVEGSTEQIWRLVLTDTVSGKEVEVYEDEEGKTAVMEGLIAGDVVRIAYEEEDDINYAVEIQVLARVNEIVAGGELSTKEVYEEGSTKGEGAEFRTVIASLKDINDSILNVVHGTDVTDELKTQENPIVNDSTKIYTVNTELPEKDEERVKGGTLSELSEGAKLLIFTESTTVRAIVIFR